jgi:LPS sulfotransferase NodH
MGQYLCIIAGQRAGTTALQGALGSTGRFFNFREIFHTDPPNGPGTFFEFAAEGNLRITDMATEEQARKIALDYLAHLRNIANERVPLLDVKLNSWHVIEPFWSYIHQMPFFMKILLEEGAVFLFVRRRDILGQVMSEQIARSTGKWHGLEEADIGAQITVDWKRAANQARLILQAETFFSSCLRASDRLIAVDYEDLYPDGLVNPRLLRALEDRIDIKLPLSLRPSIKKNIPDKARVVSNYEEASRAVDNILKNFPRAKFANQIPE